jgi:ubiquinone/menaquinone biosynthesis C-methylase UbiE
MATGAAATDHDWDGQSQAANRQSTSQPSANSGATQRRGLAAPVDMVAQLSSSILRFGWYYGVSRVMGRQAASLGAEPGYKPTRPVPTQRQLLAEIGQLVLRDAAAVRDGLYPPMGDDSGSTVDHFSRLRAMLADLPQSMARRDAADAGSARKRPESADLPDYFTQDFHFQTDGYLSPESARLYDVQVETLFLGSANLMRRSALRPIAEFLQGQDQRKLQLLDVACGTGRLLRQIRLAFPALRLTGLDLSPAYLNEARHHLQPLRAADWIEGNAEGIPLPDGSQDVVTCVFLFHELPPVVRRRVAAEMARVLKPGGLLVFIDSLQMGDRDGWDGLLEGFPVRFHEPYFRHYAIDDLDRVFADVGLVAQATSTAFLSKVITRRKA